MAPSPHLPECPACPEGSLSLISALTPAHRFPFVQLLPSLFFFLNSIFPRCLLFSFLLNSPLNKGRLFWTSCLHKIQMKLLVTKGSVSVCKCVQVCTCVHMCSCVHVCAGMCMCAHVCICVQVYACVHMCTHVHVCACNISVVPPQPAGSEDCAAPSAVCPPPPP